GDPDRLDPFVIDPVTHQAVPRARKQLPGDGFVEATNDDPEPALTRLKPSAVLDHRPGLPVARWERSACRSPRVRSPPAGGGGPTCHASWTGSRDCAGSARPAAAPAPSPSDHSPP